MVSGATETESKMEASMNQNIIYVGLDVDDTQYHCPALNKRNGEVVDFRCRPTLKGLLSQLNRVGATSQSNRGDA